MPLCTNCGTYVDYVYTQYSVNNIRLEQCIECENTADEYIEKDALNLAIDLILLKSVLVHLLFNRGTRPRYIANGFVTIPDPESERKNSEKRRYVTILRIGAMFVLLDSVIRWCHSNSLPAAPSDIDLFLSGNTLKDFMAALISCIIELALFHAGALIACTLAFYFLHVFPRTSDPAGVEKELRLSHVSLALLYASLTKLFLLLLLVVWKPTETRSSKPAWLNDYLGTLFHIFDDDMLNREWLLRNVLGGMASGFAVRVVLNGRPGIAAFVIVFAWSLKAVAAYGLSHRIRGSDHRDWLIFSMP